MMPSGKLYLIPCLLGGEDTSILPEHNKKILRQTDVFLVENLRSARRFLRSVGYTKNFDTEVTFLEFDKHQNNQNFNPILDAIKNGKNAGIISEAGNPCIADPGFQLVALAHKQQIEVVPLVGPSSILLALIASGFNGQQFSFHGYLPIENAERTKKLKQLENEVEKTGATQIFMETPYRNQKLFEQLLQTFHPDTKLCVAADLTLQTEFISTQTINNWKKMNIELHKRYVIFLIGR
jgi:16S rRNA (cytidine1402-2'-O)-methyltransferase